MLSYNNYLSKLFDMIGFLTETSIILNSQKGKMVLVGRPENHGVTFPSTKWPMPQATGTTTHST